LSECELCAGQRPIYNLTSICCCVRLILQQPSLSRRQAILEAIDRRRSYADGQAVRKAVEAAFGSARRSPTKTRS
jgi:hypothetical protein